MTYNFPDTAFAWTFYVLLVSFLTAAAYTDLRWITIPKQLTLTALGLGIIFNIVRGAWMGANEMDGLVLAGPNGLVLGGLDGLLFSLAGFGAGFGMFLLMWILGTCGGGDVKLFAALSAWVGPLYSVIILAGTIVLVFAISIARLAWGIATHGWKPTMKGFSSKAAARAAKYKNKKPGKQGSGDVSTPRHRLTTYSLPVALSTALLLLWLFRFDLQLTEPPPPKEQPQSHNRIPAPAEKHLA
jgi:prepilin peptidase CpaA